MTATYSRYILNFKNPGGTSRGILHTKETFFLEISENGKTGTGECGLFRDLSYDDRPEFEGKLQWLCDHVNDDYDVLKEELREFPAIWIGYEQASRNLKFGGDVYFPSQFTDGDDSIKINGLIWMGDPDFMARQIDEKLQENFNCIKLKIGVNWDMERHIIEELRANYPPERLELRVDANGAFSPEKAETVLKELNDLKIHSIEQPIKAGNIEDMRRLCQDTPTPIALDEELIGIVNKKDKLLLLETIKPQYIILKPSLMGGFSGSDEWIEIAEGLGIGWWITSALESNIGLNAIAQYAYTKQPKIPQGLGTGSLFTNNRESSLILNGDLLKKKA